MYLPFFNPLSNVLAIVGLLGGIAALILVALWFQRVSAHAGESPGIGWTGRLRPLLFWVTALPMGFGVVFMILFLLSWFVLALLSTIALRHGGLFLG